MNRILLILFLVPGCLWALPAKPVSIATTVSKPFVMQEQDGKLSGIYQEYLEALTRKAGLEPSFEAMPLSRVLNHASKGTHDFLMFVSGSPQAEKNYLELARFAKVQMILIGAEKNLNFIKGPVVVGRAAGSLCPLFNKDQEKQVKFVDYQSTGDALKLMRLRRINALCTNRALFYHELQKSPYSGMKLYVQSQFHYEYTISLFVHKRLSPQKISSLSKAVADPEQRKTLLSLYRKYGFEEPRDL